MEEHRRRNTTAPPRIVVDHEGEGKEKGKHDEHQFKRPAPRSPRDGGSSSKKASGDSKRLSAETHRPRRATVANAPGENRLLASAEPSKRVDRVDEDLDLNLNKKLRAGTYREPRKNARETIPNRSAEWHNEGDRKKRHVMAGLVGSLADEELAKLHSRSRHDDNRPKSAREKHDSGDRPTPAGENGHRSDRRHLSASEKTTSRERSRSHAPEIIEAPSLEVEVEAAPRQRSSTMNSLPSRSKLESDSSYVQTARDEGKKKRKVVLVAGITRKEYKMGEAVRVSVELDNLSAKPLKGFAIHLVKQGSTYEFFKKGFVEHRRLKKRGEEIYHTQKYEPQVGGGAQPGNKGPWSFRGDLDFTLPEDLAPSYTEKTANYKVVYFLKVAAMLKSKKKPREVLLKITLLERPQ